MASYWYLLLVVCIQLSYSLEKNQLYQSKCRKMCLQEEDWKKTLANGWDQRIHEGFRNCVRQCGNRNRRMLQRQMGEFGRASIRVDPDVFVVGHTFADRVTGGFNYNNNGRTSQTTACYYDVHMAEQIISVGEKQIEIVYETKTLHCSAV